MQPDGTVGEPAARGVEPERTVQAKSCARSFSEPAPYSVYLKTGAARGAGRTVAQTTVSGISRQVLVLLVL